MGLKKILIVDDSFIDREILRNILENKYEIFEADGGAKGLELILEYYDEIDVVLLDISMPEVDGFDVLSGMVKQGISEMPVVMITAEATIANVLKVKQIYNICGFISKPYDPSVVREELDTLWGPKEEVTYEGIVEAVDTDYEACFKYADKLKDLYDIYLANKKVNDEHQNNVRNIMHILLNQYVKKENHQSLSAEAIELISYASYFCNIGEMFVPIKYKMETNDTEEFQSHVFAGAELIQLNEDPAVKPFVDICSELCQKHHERVDGNGFPYALYGDEIPDNVGLCRIALDFEELFSAKSMKNDVDFVNVIVEMKADKGIYNYKLFALLEESKEEIIAYFNE